MARYLKESSGATYSTGTFDPAPSANVGSFTLVSGSGVYTKIGNLVTFSVIITISDIGTASGSWYITLPFTANASNSPNGYGYITGSGVAQMGYSAPSSSTLQIDNYDGTFSAANGSTVYLNGSFMV